VATNDLKLLQTFTAWSYNHPFSNLITAPHFSVKLKLRNRLAKW